jgi:hypothetical protein
MIRLRVLFTRDGEWWVARGLERDIAAQTRDLEDLPFEFERVLMTHVAMDLREGIEPLSRLDPAPPDVEQRWSRGLWVALDRPQFNVPNQPPIATEPRVA